MVMIFHGPFDFFVNTTSLDDNQCQFVTSSMSTIIVVVIGGDFLCESVHTLEQLCCVQQFAQVVFLDVCSDHWEHKLQRDVVIALTLLTEYC